MSKVINKSAKVRMLLRRNPNIKAAAVVETLDCTMQQAHVMLNTQRKQLHIFKRKDGVYVGKPMMDRSDVIKTPPSGGTLDKVPSIIEEHFHITIEDPVNQPSHYKVGGIETIDFIEGKNLGYNLGNAVKYISRADHKGNRLQDLQKAAWYLSREIAKSQA